MRFLTLIVILPALGAAVAAQNQSSVSTHSKMGAFVRVDNQPVQFSTVPGAPTATPTDPLAVAANSVVGGATIAHARTKVSLRVLDGLPAVRVHEAGRLAPLSAPRERIAGTSADPNYPGPVVQPHSWIVRFQGTPGQRVRVHIRMRSTRVGRDPQSKLPVEIAGLARVDVGNDNSTEFTRALDGKRYLDNHGHILGANGKLDIKIETGALVTSWAKLFASYSMTLDVSLEPVQGIVSSFQPYGPICGPDVYGIDWESGNDRHVRLVLEGARPNSPTVLLIGDTRVDVPIPGFSCHLLTAPTILLGLQTNLVGRIVNDFPGFAKNLPVDVQFQYAIFDTPTRTQMSKGVNYRVFKARPEEYEHFEINQVLSTGQSLAIGGLGSPVLSTSQKYKNTMFSTGLTGKSTSLTPLVERVWETMSSGMSALASELYARPYNDQSGGLRANTHDMLVTVHAVGGLPYILLKKGTQPFDTGMSQFRLAQAIADRDSQSHVVRCVTNVHGESDHSNYNTDYDKNLIEWQSDYEAEIQARGQTHPVPMLHTQVSSHTRYQTATSIIPGLQLDVSVTHPRKIPLVGPKYLLNYFDGVHLTSQGYRQMGEYYGKVYNHVILEGATWEPLRPVAAKLAGRVIRVRFHVPEPPLVFDTALVSDPGNLGFEYSDDSGNSPSIQAVRLIDEDTVEITLDRAPAAGSRRFVAYAHTGTPGADAGPKTGPRGCLRDSDETPSLVGAPLFNWSVHFRKEIR